MPTKKLSIEALVAEAEAIGFTDFAVDSRGGVTWGWEPLLPGHEQMRTRLARRRKELAEYLRHRMRAGKRKPLVVPCDPDRGAVVSVTIWREWTFEASHQLPLMPVGHKCRRLHGHSYRVRAFVRGPLDARGLVMDFADLDAEWAPLFAALDHRHLNRVMGLPIPTSEAIAQWIFSKLFPAFNERCRSTSLIAVEVSETTRSGARYEP